MKILITGGNGYIAKSIYSALNSRYEITLITRKDLDLTKGDLTHSWFKDKFFDVVIHCAVEGGSRLKQDTSEVIDNNLLMYYNLLQQKNQYKKFIHFGSGAELYAKDAPYGLSKHIIRQSILSKENFYNLRIFGVFDENELDTRFIKSSIVRYINKQPIIVHQDKYMDFMYMQDLIKVVDYYINQENLNKEVNCAYNTVCSLTKIADIINNLSDYRVNIEVGKDRGQDYTSGGISILMNFIGLQNGIKQVYEKLKNAE